MLTISKLFGRSPFMPLQHHLHKVADCVGKLTEIFDCFFNGDNEKVKEYAKEISELEHAADLAKNDIRNHLPKGLFLPVDRSNILDMLSLQDSIADTAEDIGVLLTLRPLTHLKFFEEELRIFILKNIQSFGAVQLVVEELEELLQSGFGGYEADKVRSLVDDVAYKEHEADILQQSLLQHLFAKADDMPHWEFYLWLKIFEAIAAISNLSEKLGYRVRMTLENK